MTMLFSNKAVVHPAMKPLIDFRHRFINEVSALAHLNRINSAINNIDNPHMTDKRLADELYTSESFMLGMQSQCSVQYLKDVILGVVPREDAVEVLHGRYQSLSDRISSGYYNEAPSNAEVAEVLSEVHREVYRIFDNGL